MYHRPLSHPRACLVDRPITHGPKNVTKTTCFDPFAFSVTIKLQSLTVFFQVQHHVILFFFTFVSRSVTRAEHCSRLCLVLSVLNPCKKQQMDQGNKLSLQRADLETQYHLVFSM